LTIKLYATRDEALGVGGFADRGFAPSNVLGGSIDRVTIPGHHFADMQAVTYRAAPAPAFNSLQVDVTVSGTTFTPADNNEIYLQGHGFSEGDRVIYRNSAGTDLMGLDDGGVYYVLVLDANRIQLANSPDEADPDDGDGVDENPIPLSPDTSPNGVR